VVSELLIVFALIIANAFFAGAEIAVVAVRRTRLEELREESAAARAVIALREQPERFLATVQVGITVVSATAAAFGGAAIAERLAPQLSRAAWLAPYAEELALAIVVGGVSYASIVLGELVPKSLALRSAERFSLRVGRFFVGLSWLARPIVWLLSGSANVVLRPFSDRTTFTETRHSADELQQLVEEASKAGTINPEAGEIAARALELPELTAADVLVPRQDVVMVPLDAGHDEVARLLHEHRHSRFPVYYGDPENVVGYLNTKDLVVLAEEARPHVRTIVRPPFFVPEPKPVVDLLREMRERRLPFAIVVDEQGALAGIVTMEDLLEELVGEIFSEHLAATRHVQKSEDGSWLLSGQTPVREAERALEIDLPEGSWTTIAGLCLALAERIPSKGDRLALPDGTTLEVVDATERRVTSVRVTPPPSEPP
jgi:putative hemolysin